MSGGRVAWCRQSSPMISLVLSALTCIMAYSYWSISQEYVILENKVRICNQKEVDFAGVAAECKKRVTELHDKISILTSDKEVLATQKNSLQEWSKHNIAQVDEFKAKANLLQGENDKLKAESAESTKVEAAKLTEALAQIEQAKSGSASTIADLEAELQTAKDKILLLEANAGAAELAKPEDNAEVVERDEDVESAIDGA